MKKELHLVIFIAALLMIAFILSVVITENKNIDSIRETYSASNQIDDGGKVLVPAPTERAVQFQENKAAVWIIRLLVSFGIPLFFLFSGLSVGIKKWALSKSTNFIIALALYFIVYSLIDYLLNFPLDFYSGFIRLHSYGLSNQTFMKWFGDSLKSLALYTIATAAFIWVPYMIIKKSPGYWWLYMGLLSIPILLFISYISPLYIDPIFNKYQPVQNEALEEKIHDELHLTTIGDCNVYQVDKSVDTNEMNAYMTGVFNTKRIVLWDTTINKLDDREILGILAHEMGHYLMGHVWKSIVLGGGLCILVLYFVNKSALWILSKSGGVFGFTKLHDIASLPLLILLINVFMFIAAPAENAYSRHIETEADRFELELTHDNYAAASAMVKLHWESLTLPTPGSIYKLWNYDHPTFKERVDFDNNYRPWEENGTIRYQKYIVK